MKWLAVLLVVSLSSSRGKWMSSNRGRPRRIGLTPSGPWSAGVTVTTSCRRPNGLPTSRAATWAEIRAIVKTGTIPHGAASLAFATIVTRNIDVEMEKTASRWVVVKETVVSEDVSTYEDRKDSQLDR